MVVVLALRLRAGVMGANPPTDILIDKGGALDRAKLVHLCIFESSGHPGRKCKGCVAVWCLNLINESYDENNGLSARSSGYHTVCCI